MKYEFLSTILNNDPLPVGLFKILCAPVFITALFTIDKAWKQPKCLLTDEWKGKCCIYIQWNPTLKRKVGLTCVIMWMNLEDIALGEISQSSQKGKKKKILLFLHLILSVS